jgi:hypothetical protein
MASAERRIVKLPLAFDPLRLRLDLQRISPAEFVPHFNRDYHEGEWSGAPLRSPGGAADRIHPDPAAPADAYAATPLLERCPYLSEVLAAFSAPLRSVRLLRLAPGAVIREHRDADLGEAIGEVRLHVPVLTNPEVEFLLDGRRVEMREGECWYLDLSRPHSVANRGATDRVHLVIDAVLDDRLRELLAAGSAVTGSAPSRLPASDLERLRELLLRDVGRAAHLAAASEEPGAFLAELRQMAGELGLPGAAAQAETALRRPAARREMDAGWLPSADWVPFRIVESAWPAVEWCHLAGRRYTEPFFEDTVRRCLSHPFNRLFRPRTPVADLANLHPGRPAGLIFHTSRCGSTLVSQMLAVLPGTIMVSEAEPVDTLLRGFPGLREEERTAALRGLLGALGRPRNPGERHLVFKLDAWSALQLPLLRRAFPGVPWAFVYRDPVEVLVSHQRQPGRHMVPGLLQPPLPGLDPAGIPREEYAARVLAAIVEAVLEEHRPGESLLVAYPELPGAVTSLLDHFGIETGDEDEVRLREAAARDAKDPARRFEPDGAAKQAEVAPIIRTHASRLEPLFARLEAARRDQPRRRLKTDS